MIHRHTEDGIDIYIIYGNLIYIDDLVCVKLEGIGKSLTEGHGPELEVWYMFMINQNNRISVFLDLNHLVPLKSLFVPRNYR